MGDLSPSSKVIKHYIKSIKESIRSIYIESCKSGIPTTPTVETLLQVRPECTQILCKLAESGISWEFLIKYSDLEGVKLRPHELTRTLTAPHISHKLEKTLYFVVSKLKSLFEEMRKYGDTAPYVSRDVFCTVYHDVDRVVEKLERKNITWTTLMHLAGLPLNDMLSSETRRHSAITCKTFLESCGVTIKHLILFQKLIIFIRAEHPETLSKFIKDTFGVDVVNDRFYTYMLSRLAEVINYLKLIA